MARIVGARTQEIAKKSKYKVKDIPWEVHAVKSTYDQALDDYMLDGMEPTGQVVNLSSKTSNEQILVTMKISRRNFKAFISKNEVFICNKKTNEPCFCLKRMFVGNIS